MHHRTQNPLYHRHDREAQRQGFHLRPYSVVKPADSDEGCQHVSQTNNNGARRIRSCGIPCTPPVQRFSCCNTFMTFIPVNCCMTPQQNAKKHAARRKLLFSFEQRAQLLCFNLQNLRTHRAHVLLPALVSRRQQDAFEHHGETAFRRNQRGSGRGRRRRSAAE